MLVTATAAFPAVTLSKQLFFGRGWASQGSGPGAAAGQGTGATAAAELLDQAGRVLLDQAGLPIRDESTRGPAVLTGRVLPGPSALASQGTGAAADPGAGTAPTATTPGGIV